jgi:hypothetical protein
MGTGHLLGRMRTSSGPAALFTIAVLFLGCGSDDTEGTGSPSSTAAASSTTGTGGAGGSGGGGGGGGGGLTCEEACPKIAAAACPTGPPSASICTSFCNGLLNGSDATCKAAMQGLISCMSEQTMPTCDADGNTTSSDCAPEFAAVVPCLPGA